MGAEIPNGQIYVLARDVVPLDHPFDEFGNDKNIAVDINDLEPGNVRLRSYKRPRPITLRANIGDTLEINFTNLLPPDTSDTSEDFNFAGVQVMGLDWDKDKLIISIRNINLVSFI